MKRTFIIIVLTIFLFSFGKSKAGDGLDFGIFAGVSTPNDYITNLYNSNTYKDLSDNPYNLIYGSSKSGWHIGVDVRIKLDKDANTFLHGSFAWHRFEAVENDVVVDQTKKPLFNTTTSVLPVSVGIDYYLFRSIIGLYVRGDAQFNTISTKVNDVYQAVSTITNMSDASNSRFGAALGGGVELNLLLIKADLEIKYNWINLVGKTVDEKPKNYLSTSVIIYL